MTSTTMQDIQHRALEQAIELARDCSEPDSPLLVYRPPDQNRYFVTFKSSVEDYHPEWVVWPVEAV